jgi:hypothetical protein
MAQTTFAPNATNSLKSGGAGIGAKATKAGEMMSGRLQVGEMMSGRLQVLGPPACDAAIAPQPADPTLNLGMRFPIRSASESTPLVEWPGRSVELS